MPLLLADFIRQSLQTILRITLDTTPRIRTSTRALVQSIEKSNSHRSVVVALLYIMINTLLSQKF